MYRIWHGKLIVTQLMKKFSFMESKCWSLCSESIEKIICSIDYQGCTMCIELTLPDKYRIKFCMKLKTQRFLNKHFSWFYHPSVQYFKSTEIFIHIADFTGLLLSNRMVRAYILECIVSWMDFHLMYHTAGTWLQLHAWCSVQILPSMR
jgi:uncharacterized protein YdaL